MCMLAAGPRRMSELAGLLGIEKAALTGLAAGPNAAAGRPDCGAG